MRGIVFGICMAISIEQFQLQTYDPSEDINLNSVQFIEKYGYPVDTYEVITEDGYYLTVYRIKHGKHSQHVNHRPIFLMHGLFSAMDCFTVSAPINASLAFLLADVGYDVWLGNARGTRHSRKHKVLNDSIPSYWNYSWHEIGVYDLPAMIDWVLAKTHSKSIVYVGHSQGATTALVLLSEKPNYNDKILSLFLLAPPVFMDHIPFSFAKVLANSLERLEALTKIIGLVEYLPNVNEVLVKVCQSFNSFCSTMLGILCGFCNTDINKKIIPLAIKTSVHPICYKQLAHYGQGVKSGHFRQYDYGPKENMERYGASNPPDYKLSNILVPTSLFYGDSDALIGIPDVQRLTELLPNMVLKQKIPIKKFNHLDFIVTEEAKHFVYGPILRHLENYYLKR